MNKLSKDGGGGGGRAVDYDNQNVLRVSFKAYPINCPTRSYPAMSRKGHMSRSAK